MSSPANISSSFPGRTQDERVLSALAPTTFGVDERDTADLLSFVVKFGKVLSYFDPKNKLDGNWRQLLLADPVLLIAYVMKTDSFMEFSRFLDYRDGIFASPKLATQQLFSQQFFSIGFHLILRINRWYQLSKQPLSYTPFRDYLQRMIEEEGRGILKSFYDLYFKLCEWIPGYENQALSKLEDLDRIWMFNPFPCIEKKKLSDEEAMSNLIRQQVEQAVLVGQTLFHLQDKIIEASKGFYKDAIQQKNIAPHTGLLLSFLDLFKHHQQDLNQLTGSHLEFYYRSILGFKNLGPQADTTFISVQLAKRKPSFVLDKGTAFSAGNNQSGQVITFLTQDDLTVNAGVIKAYQTLNFDYLADGNLGELYSGKFTSFDALSAPSWPVFGSTTPLNVPYTIKGKQDLGFAIACPDLILNSGERTITFRFLSPLPTNGEDVANPSTIEWEVNPSSDSPTATSSSGAGSSGEIILPLFNLQLTTAKGWLAIEGQQIAIATDYSYMSMTIQLAEEDAAIVAYNQKIHGAGFETTWPVCKATLATDVPSAIFEFLRGFTPQQLVIDTVVDSATDFVLQTDRGKVTTKIPFQPFGNAPLPGANLFIGGQELFVKPIDTLSFAIEWDHLPDDFEIYYKGYDNIYDNSIFQADLSYWGAAGDWVALKEDTTGLQFPLFTKTDPTDSEPSDSSADKTAEDEVTNLHTLPIPITNPRALSFSIPSGKYPVQPGLPVIPSFTQQYKSAFLKLSFVAPDYGFGTEEYPKVLSRITLENGQAIIHNSKSCGKKEDKPTCVSAVYCEALYVLQSTTEQYENQFNKQLKKVDDLNQLLTDAGKSVCKLLKNCDTPKACLTPLKQELDSWEAKLQNDLSNQHQAVHQQFDKTIEVFEAFVKKYADLIPKEVKVGDAGESKNIIDFLIDTIEGVASLWKGPLEKVVLSLGEKLFGYLGEKLKGVLDKVFHEIADVSKWYQKLIGWISKVFGGGEKTLELPAASKGKKDKEESVSDIEKDIDNKENLEITYHELVERILTQFKSCATDLERSEAPSEKACDDFVVCLKGIEPTLKKYKAAITGMASLFQILKQFIAALIAASCNAYIPLQALPNKPFIPKIKHLKSDYTASTRWPAEEKTTPNFQFYHLEPFGMEEVKIDGSGWKLFPNFDAIPYVLLGFQKLEPGEPLTILLTITSQLKVLNSKTKNNISYEYLSETGWQPLILESDGTYSFEQSGIIQFIVPKDITDQSTLMPADFFWLRIGKQPSESKQQDKDESKPVTIETNFIATQAVRVERNLDGQTSFDAITPGKIKAIVLPTPTIKTIKQPLTSIGGQSAENTEQLYQRAAYRLKHKNRIVLPADLENLVLQTFDFLYRATAAPMSYYGDDNSRVVRLALVPYTSTQSKHPYRPLVAPSILRQVLDFLQKQTLPSMELELVNPDFRELRITAKVQFTQSNAGQLLCKQLNEELIDFLSPWFKDNPSDKVIGGTYTLTTFRAFILSRSYVKGVSYLCYELGEVSQKLAACVEEPLPICDPPNIADSLNPWELVVPSFQHCIIEQKDTDTPTQNHQTKHNLIAR